MQTITTQTYGRAQTPVIHSRPKRTSVLRRLFGTRSAVGHGLVPVTIEVDVAHSRQECRDVIDVFYDFIFDYKSRIHGEPTLEGIEAGTRIRIPVSVRDTEAATRLETQLRGHLRARGLLGGKNRSYRPVAAWPSAALVPQN